jgi:ribosome modulation factor
MAKALTDKASNVSDATINKHIRTVTSLKAAADSAHGEYRAALKAAKTDGVDTKELTEALKAKRLEPEDVVRSLHTRIRYLALVNIPVHQMDLFGGAVSVGTAALVPDDDLSEEDAEHARWEAQEVGHKAGLDGDVKENNPHVPGTFRHQAWFGGWKTGQEQLAAGPSGIKKASTRRTRRPAAGAHVN